MSTKAVEDDIEKQYELVENLGSGAFGHLILIRSKMNEEEYACKIEKNHGKKMILVEKQFKMFAELMDSKLFPEVYTYKVLEQHSYMIMEKLDQTLEQCFKKVDNKFSLKTIALIMNQMVGSLMDLHQHGYIHRDIKPENIMTCCTSHQIKLIDFGLAASLFAKQSTALIGNVRFCSRRAHFGFSGKKEDLESLLYLIYYFLMQNLPWQSATKEDIQYEIQRDLNANDGKRGFILEKKDNFLNQITYPKTVNEVSIAFYNELHQFATVIHNLTDDDEINYKNLVHRTQRLMCIVGVEKGHCFDWCKKNCSFRKPYSDYWKVFN